MQEQSCGMKFIWQLLYIPTAPHNYCYTELPLYIPTAPHNYFYIELTLHIPNPTQMSVQKQAVTLADQESYLVPKILLPCSQNPTTGPCVTCKNTVHILKPYYYKI